MHARPGLNRATNAGRRVCVRTLGAVLCCAVAGCFTVRAGGSGDDAAARAVEEHDRLSERRVLGLWGLGVSEELVLSASLGFVVASQPPDFDCTTVCELRGPYVQIEPGLGAGKLSVGRAAIVGEQRRREHFLAHVYFAYGIKGSLMRTWSRESSETPGETWIGVEGEATAVMVNVSLGLFRRVSGDGGDWLVSAGVGWGF